MRRSESEVAVQREIVAAPLGAYYITLYIKRRVKLSFADIFSFRLNEGYVKGYFQDKYHFSNQACSTKHHASIYIRIPQMSAPFRNIHQLKESVI